jgi:hypothetical protein
MRGLRWTAGLGALLALLAGCQTVAPDHVPTQPKTVLANGQPLPSGCSAGDGIDGHTVAFVADGNAWVLDPSTMDVSCVFAAPQPGPFTWNPRGDRALLDGLRIESIRGHELRSPTLPTSPISAWGHPIGKAVVFVSPNQHQLVKVYPGTQQHDEITPVAGVRYLDVVYHPSGLAIAFIVDTRKRQEIWLSSNIGRDPVRLVFAVNGTTFGPLAFTTDGTTLLYGAVHADNAPLLHALDLRDPSVNQGLWHGDPGDRITSISPQPSLEGDLIAFTLGSSCSDSRAMIFRRGKEATPLAPAPSRVVGWLDDETVLVGTGGCTTAGTTNLSAVNVTQHQDAMTPLVSGVEFAAARTPLLGTVPPLPQDIVQKVGSGVG